MERLTVLDPNKSQEDFIVFCKPDIGIAEKEAVLKVLDSGWLSTGRVVKKFEDEFQQFIGGGHAVAVSSCTEGLILSLLTIGVEHGDEVITTPMTFAATVNAILAVGAKPVFVDVKPSGHMDADAIESVITERTKAILPVHYTGSSCDMKKIREISGKYHNIKIIEDAAHAFDGFHANGDKVGTVGDFTCFSFYATKNITCGEGGMVMVKNIDDAEKLRVISMQGLSKNAYNRYGKESISTYEVSYPGRKSNLSDIHAAIGLAQLRRWPELKEKREAVWKVYERAFGRSVPGHAKHLFTILNDDRDGLREHLFKNGIGTGINFKPLHLEPAYWFLNHKKSEFPVSEFIGEQTLSLPVSATMTKEDAERVVEAVHNYGEGGKSGV